MMPLGLAGWFLGALFTRTPAPGWFIAGPVVVVPGTGLLIGLGAHLARPTAKPGPRFTAAEAVEGTLLGSLAGTGLWTPDPRDRRRRAGREPRSGVPRSKSAPSACIGSARGNSRFNCMGVIPTVLYMQL